MMINAQSTHSEEDSQISPLAVVTGAAHRMGKAIALRLAKEGYAVVLHYAHSNEEAEHTRQEIESCGAEVYLCQADLSDPIGIRHLFSEISQIPHPLKVLVNSAGLMRKSSLVDVTVDEWDATMALNLRAPLICSQEAVKLMADTGGVIINITDTGSRKTWSSFGAYSVSKAGLEALTRLMARSLAPKVRVNAVAPGLILPPNDLPDQQWERLIQRVPMKRAGSAQQIADAVLFLVNNSYITGETLVVDGGYQLI